VELVRSRFDYGIDLRAAKNADVAGRPCTGDLYLLNIVHRRRDVLESVFQFHVANAIECEGGALVNDSVHGRRDGAVGADARSGFRRRADTGFNGAGHDLNQLGIHAPEKRQLRNLGGADVVAHGGGFRVYQLGGARNLNKVAAAPDLQTEIDRGQTVHDDDHILGLGNLEALRRRGDDIFAGWQVGGQVLAGRGRGDLRLVTRRLIGQVDLGAGNDGIGWIVHRPLNTPGHALTVSNAARHQ
jgi:hypothetical protein